VRQLIETISRLFLGLRLRLLLLVLLVCAPLIALTLHTASHERRQAVTAWRERAQRLSRQARRAEDNLLSQSRRLLLAVSESSAVQSGTRQARKRSLEKMFASYPNYSNLGVADTNGEVLASAVPLGEIDNPVDRKFCQRVLTTHAFIIGDWSAPPTNGKPTVTFGCPVFDESDHVQAVLFATVATEWLGGARSDYSALLPRGAAWTEMDRQGRVLVHSPAGRLAWGQPFPDHTLASTVLSQPGGIVKADDANGTAAFYAFTWRDSQLIPGGIVTLLSLPERILFANANWALFRSLTWLGIAVGLALGFGWVGSHFLVMRQVKALVRASARLATGDLSARTGLRHGKDELGQLTRNFDQMAQALEQREMQRQLAEETLQTRDHMIRELPLVPAAVCVCDQHGVVDLYNRTAIELWGWEPPVGSGSQLFCGSYELFHPDGTPMPHSESPAAEALRSGASVRNRELLIGRPDGSRVPVLINVVLLRDSEGSTIGAVTCFQDITERKQAEDRLRESNDNLQFLSRRLVESQETERRHIARELHDEVGQSLTVAEMNLQALVQTPGAAPLKGRLKESLQAVERVLEQVRDLSLNLRPSMLDDLGLEPALRWYTKRQAAVAKLKTEFLSDTMEDRLDPMVETACFRVAQEALTNVARHARAQRVTVELRRRDGHLHLFVRDDGAGFDVAALRERAVMGASLGLLSMEERATLTDGGLECKSAPGQGTQIHAWFPLKWRTPNS
jgi:PAS domain S-box-containing protein